jgi:(p)ppGpp synthase/HD superfamily hydrolase
MQLLFEKAISIALRAHKGKKDKGGNPYILHPLRIMVSMDTLEEKIVAVLHDVIEDSDISIEYLTKLKFPESIINAIALLSKTKNQDYNDYINSIKKNKLATKIKIADLEDNMNLSRLKSITEKDKKRLVKYKTAYNNLIKK